MSILQRVLGAGTVASLALTAAVIVPIGGTPAAAASAAAEDHGHVATAYTLEILAPTNSGVVSSALGVNDRGDVVGITRPTSSAQPQQTVLWERHGDHFHAHELANLEGSQFSRGFDLTDTQQIVGEAFNAGGGSIPVRWDGDSAPQHVTSLNEAGTGILNDIADDGVAVGTASGAGVRVAPDGAVTVLPKPVTGIDGASVKTYTATAVAGGDVIGGRATVAVPHGDHTHDELRGVVWEDGTGRLLALPEGASSPVVAHVTPDAEAIGGVTAGGKETAVVWTAGDTPEMLPLPGVADYTHASAKAASDGVVVGSTTKFAGNPSFGGAAVAWDAHGPVDLAARVVDLPAGLELLAANDINESGQIVGSAKTAEGNRGFVLTPAEASGLSIDGLGHHYHSGSPISLSAVTTPEDPDAATYRWSVKRVDQTDFVVDASQTTGTFGVTAEQALHGAEIKVERIEDGEVVLTSPSVVVDVDDHGQPAPQVVAISGGSAVAAGDQVALTASVAPATVLDDHQWYVTKAGASAPEPIDGATDASYAFTALAAHDGAFVTVSVTGEDGTVIYGPSAPVLLTVAPATTPTPAPTPAPAPTPTLAPTPTPAPPGPVVKADARVVVKAPSTVRRGAVARIKVAVRARGEVPSGKVRIKVAGKTRTVALDAKGKVIVKVRMPRRTRPGKKKVVVTYLGDDAVARDKHRTTVRVVR